jgi:hypothetical protein
MEGLLQLRDEHRAAWGLPRIATAETEQLLDEGLVPMSPSLTAGHVVFNDAPDHGLDELVRDLFPRAIGPNLSNWVPTILGEPREGLIASRSVLRAQFAQRLP